MVKGAAADWSKTDVWSVGAVALELFGGHLSEEDGVIKERPEDLERVNALSALIRDMLEISPVDRPTAQEALETAMSIAAEYDIQVPEQSVRADTAATPKGCPMSASTPGGSRRDRPKLARA